VSESRSTHRSETQAVQRVHAIAEQLRELRERLGESSSPEVELSLLERATDLADEAARLLEQVSKELA
jgi:hypothetical protein